MEKQIMHGNGNDIYQYKPVCVLFMKKTTIMF